MRYVVSDSLEAHGSLNNWFQIEHLKTYSLHRLETRITFVLGLYAALRRDCVVYASRCIIPWCSLLISFSFFFYFNSLQETPDALPDETRLKCPAVLTPDVEWSDSAYLDEFRSWTNGVFDSDDTFTQDCPLYTGPPTPAVAEPEPEIPDDGDVIAKCRQDNQNVEDALGVTSSQSSDSSFFQEIRKPLIRLDSRRTLQSVHTQNSTLNHSLGTYFLKNV